MEKNYLGFDPKKKKYMPKLLILCLLFFQIISIFPFTVFGEDDTKENKENIVYNFEDGTLQNWSIVEGQFDCIVSSRPCFHNFPDTPYNKEGKYYLSTVESQPGQGSKDRMTGIVESPIIILSKPGISFLIGAGQCKNSYVAVYTLDGREFRRYRGLTGLEKMIPIKDTLPELVGKPIFFRLVDNETGPWGHVTFDDFRANGQIDEKATVLHRFNGQMDAKLKNLNALLINWKNNDSKAELDTFSILQTLQISLDQLVKRIDSLRTDTTPKEVDSLNADFSQLLNSVEKVREQRRELFIASTPELVKNPILYVVRKEYQSHYHAIDTLFNSDEYNCNREMPHKNLFTPGSALKLFDAKTKQSVTLIETSLGCLRDPDVGFDGDRIVLAIRNDRDSDYHIWEITLKEGHSFQEILNQSEKRKDTERKKVQKIEGTDILYHPFIELRQLTHPERSADFDPIYLSDGTIVFASTREPKYNMCSRDIASDLYRMNGDGSNIYQITKSTLFEHNPVLLPDGRICYHRWEYVDRNFGDAHSLWTVTPNGTNQSVYWGNNTAVPAGIYNPACIEETGELICIFGPHHTRENGALAIIDRRLGLDGQDPVIRTWPENFKSLIRSGGNFDCDTTVYTVPLKYEDPFVINESRFLVSRMTVPDGKTGLYLLDRTGSEFLILEEESDGIYDPCLIRTRQKPPLLEGARDFGQKEGTCYIANVYEGTHMKSVVAGSVKYLRVIQSPEKKNFSCGQWDGQGYTAPGMNWHSLENKKILGTATVEEDGSVAFKVPCDTFLYFQLLDTEGRMIQTMRSGTVLQSGEIVSCVGCHEDRLQTPMNISAGKPIAMIKQPQILQTWYGSPREFGYMNEVQPVFDRLCVECHDYGKPAGLKLNLAADRDLVFNTSYINLWNSSYIKCIGAGPAELLDNHVWGSLVSPLVQELDNPKIPEHIESKLKEKLTKEDKDRICTWIDLNGVYYPYYESIRPNNLSGRSPLDPKELNRLGELTGIRYARIAHFNLYKAPEFCFERPELSPALNHLLEKLHKQYPGISDEQLKQNGSWQEMLTIIRTGAVRLREHPRADMPGFVPCQKDLERLKKYDYRRSEELRFRQAIQNGKKVYDP